MLPAEVGRAGPTSVIAEEMIQRRREKATLDALEELVFYLGGLREERKAHPARERRLAAVPPEPRSGGDGGTPQRPGVYVGPDGRHHDDRPAATAGRGHDAVRQDRVALAGDRRRAPLPATSSRVANRANASFYPIEPRGLVVFDTDIGPEPAAAGQCGLRMLRQRHETLKTAALNTDGIAVMDSNDINAGLQRVVDRPVVVLPPRLLLDQREGRRPLPDDQGARETARH